MTTVWRTLAPLAAALVVAGSCSVPRGAMPAPSTGETAASGRRKVIDLDELTVSGVATKAAPDGDDGGGSTGLTSASIRALVRAHQAPLRACYARGLARDPALAGTVVLRFDVDPNGGVQNLAVSRSTLTAPDVVQCLVQVFARLPFPRPAGRTTVVYPLTFRPER